MACTHLKGQNAEHRRREQVLLSHLVGYGRCALLWRLPRSCTNKLAWVVLKKQHVVLRFCAPALPALRWWRASSSSPRHRVTKSLSVACFLIHLQYQAASTAHSARRTAFSVHATLWAKTSAFTRHHTTTQHHEHKSHDGPPVRHPAKCQNATTDQLWRRCDLEAAVPGALAAARVLSAPRPRRAQVRSAARHT